MARCFHDPQGQPAQGQHVALLIIPLVLLVHPGEQQLAAPPGHAVLLVDVHRYVRVSLQQGPHGGGVVKVPVGQQDVLECTAALSHQLFYPRFVVAGIDQGTDLRVLVAQQVAVGHDRAHLQCFDGHGVLLTECRCPE